MCWISVDVKDVANGVEDVDVEDIDVEDIDKLMLKMLMLKVLMLKMLMFFFALLGCFKVVLIFPVVD